VWLIDPRQQTLEVLSLGARGKWRESGVLRGSDKVRAVPFDAIELDLGALWI